MRRIIFAVVLASFGYGSQAQISGFLKDRVEKGKTALKEKANEKAEEKADAKRDRLDSTDFNYAISVIDNSGMMNVRDLDETLTKSGYALLKDDTKKTPAQKCRDLLTQAQALYGRRFYKTA